MKIFRRLITCFLIAFNCCALDPVKSQDREISRCGFGVVLHGFPITNEQLTVYPTRLGCKPDSVTFFISWQHWEGSEFVKLLNTVNNIKSTGALPIVTWEPMEYSAGKERSITLEELEAGNWDLYIKKISTILAAADSKIIIRLAHEMNLQRYHWTTKENEFSATSPARYRRFYQYVVTLFNSSLPQLKSSNKKILFAFNPNHESVPHPAYNAGYEFNTIAAYYPGSDYVDLVGLDGYNWGTTLSNGDWQSRWQTPAEIFSASLTELKTLAPDKPIYVFETSSIGSEEEKRTWLTQLQSYCHSSGLAGCNWFDVQKERDWTLPAKSAPGGK